MRAHDARLFPDAPCQGISMTVDTRTIAAVVLAGAVTTGLVVAQGAGTPAPQGQPPAGQTPPPPAGGRGGDPGQRGAAPEGGRQGRGGRAGGYTQYTRPLASEDVIVRGKALYGTNCASCHAVDLRGTADGKNPNLLRSGVALRDQKGELIGARVAKHTPPSRSTRRTRSRSPSTSTACTRRWAGRGVRRDAIPPTSR